jgi:hypothetical protein
LQRKAWRWRKEKARTVIHSDFGRRREGTQGRAREISHIDSESSNKKLVMISQPPFLYNFMYVILSISTCSRK